MTSRVAIAEHFHGKEGVAGSSPAEGFIGTPRYGGVFSFPGRSRHRRLGGLWVPSGSHWVPRGTHKCPLPKVGGGWLGSSSDKAADAGSICHAMSPLTTTTPFYDLEPSAVLKPKDIAARLDVDERSVRR